MRYDFKEPVPETILGSTKIVRKFLWFPKWTDKEIRWLEFANCQYRCRTIRTHVPEMKFYFDNLGWAFEGFAE